MKKSKIFFCLLAFICCTGLLKAQIGSSFSNPRFLHFKDTCDNAQTTTFPYTYYQFTADSAVLHLRLVNDNSAHLDRITTIKIYEAPASSPTYVNSLTWYSTAADSLQLFTDELIPGHTYYLELAAQYYACPKCTPTVSFSICKLYFPNSPLSCNNCNATNCNIVSNNDFEFSSAVNNNPTGVAQFMDVCCWDNPTGGTSDYFSQGGTGGAGYNNLYGCQPAYSGTHYAGIGMIASDTLGREYLQSQLTQTMNAGEVYRIGFAYTISDKSLQGTSRLGVLFSSNALTQASSQYLNAPGVPYTPHATVGICNANSLAWTLYSQNFTVPATAPFNWLTIGNFDNTFSGNTSCAHPQTVCNTAGTNTSYYFIDSVFVRLDSLAHVTLAANPVCTGDPATFFINGPADYTYTWNDGVHAPFNSNLVAVTPFPINAATSFTVTYTPQNFATCAISNTVTITIAPLPLPVITVTSPTICLGQTANPAASGGVSYSWSTGAGTTSIAVSPTSTTNYTVTGTGANGCKNTAVSTVTVTAPINPGITSNSVNMCANSGNTATYTATGTGITTYNWSLPNGGTIISGQGTNTINVNWTGISTTGQVCVNVGNGFCTTNFCISVQPCCPPPTGIPIHYSSTNNVITAASYPNGVAGAGTFYYLSGNFIIPSGSNVTLDYSTFYMAPGSSITVQNTATLNLKHSHLYSPCNQMWKGIKMGIVSTIITCKETLIEDALVAIDAGDGAFQINLSDAWFNRNGIGVKAANLGTGFLKMEHTVFTSRNNIQFNPNGAPWYVMPIVGTTAPNISSKVQLPLKSNLVYPAGKFAQIGLQTAAMGNVSFNITLPTVNLFDKLEVGIETSSGQYNINYCQFQWIGNFTPTYVPVQPINTGIRTISFNSQIGGLSRSCTFLKNQNDIWSTGTSKLSIIYNTFGPTRNVAFHMNSNTNGTVRFSHNTLNDIHGIDIANNAGVKCNIDTNLIAQSIPGANMTGITINELFNTANYKMRNDTLRGMYKGIFIQGADSAVIKQCKITTTPTSTGNFAYAVKIANNTNAFIEENKLRSIPTSHNYGWWLYGILAESSPNSIIHCNTIKNIGVPMQLKGNMPSKIWTNDMDNGIVGIWLAINGFVGNLSNGNYNTWPTAPFRTQDNKWGNFTPGIFGTGGADTYSSGSSTGTTIVYGAQQTWFPPAQFKPFNNYNEFVPSSTPFFSLGISTTYHPDTTCFSLIPLLPPPPSGGDVILKAANVQLSTAQVFGVNDAEAKYMGKKALHSHIRQNGIDVSADTSLSQFMTVSNSGSTGLLFLTDSLLSFDDSLLALQAMSVNNSLSPNGNIEQNHKQFNTIRSNGVINKGYSPSEIFALQQMAVLCPFTEGTAVYQARAALRVYDTTEYFNPCEFPDMPASLAGARAMRPQSLAGEGMEQGIGIYPNPAGDKLNFSIFELNDFAQYEVKILNMFGDCVLKQNLTKSGESLNPVSLTILSGGTYIVQVFEDGKKVFSDRLIIIR